MGISRVVASSTATTFFVDAAANTAVYAQAISLAPGVYTVSCVNTTNATVNFWSADNEVITSVTTVSGTVTAALNVSCARVTYSINTGTNIRISLALSGSLVGSGATGTLDAITSSGTYTPAAPGIARVLLIGGGGGGSAGAGPSGGDASGGGGGGSGFATLANLKLTGDPIAVTLGAGGAAAGAGGTTTFGALTAAGGGAGDAGVVGSRGGFGGTGGSNGGNGGRAVTGQSGGAGGTDGTPGSGVSVRSVITPGSGGAATSWPTAGRGGGIYGGGSGGSCTGAPGNSAGGGGGGGVAGNNGSGNTPGTGGAGRVWVLRWT